MATAILLRPCYQRGIGNVAFTYARGHHTPSNTHTLRDFAGLRIHTRGFTTMDQGHVSDAEHCGLQIKRTLSHIGHKYWGFTIYRCTYSDDDAWTRFMATLDSSVRESLAYYGTGELAESLDCSVHQDASVLNGAGKEAVRQRFREWTAGAAAEAERQTADSQPIHIDGVGSTPRYNYCIHVDEAALHSITGSNAAADNASSSSGYVNLVAADWELPGPEEAEARRREFDIEDAFDEGEEAVDGCKMHDVGWMKVSVRELMPAAYATLQTGAWDENYVRPPRVATF